MENWFQSISGIYTYYSFDTCDTWGISSRVSQGSTRIVPLILVILVIRGELVPSVKKKTNPFTEPVFTGGVRVFGFLKKSKKVKRHFKVT